MKRTGIVMMMLGCLVYGLAVGQDTPAIWEDAAQSEFVLPIDFATAQIVRQEELSPLEQQIQELEWRLQNNGQPEPLDEATFAIVKAQLADLYAQRPRERMPLDDGANTCPAPLIPQLLPYTDTGTTLGATNNFSPLTPCGTTNAPDKIYRYIPTYTGIHFIDTFGSDFDTYLYIRTGGACPGNTHVDCNDDAWFTLQSRLQVSLNVGQEYFIIVDGAGTSAGNYVLHVENNCNIGTSNTAPFGECAETANSPAHASQDCNGGCGNTNYGGSVNWQEISPCQFVFGRGFTYLGPQGQNLRDVDWYRFTLFESCSLRIGFVAEFNAGIFISDVSTCQPNFYFTASALACQSYSFMTVCFPPGTYALGVMPAFVAGMPAPREYFFSLDHFPCSGCKIDAGIVVFTSPVGIQDSTCGAGNDCGLRPSADRTYCITIPQTSDYTFSLCGSSPAWNSYMYLTSTCCGNIIAQNNDGCEGSGLSSLECVSLQAGYYYLTIEGNAAGDCGSYTLLITNCRGSCCYGDPANPSCQFTTPSVCATLGGQYTEGQQCTPGLCYTRPVCEDGSQFSQLPHLPDETWSAFATDYWLPNRLYEDYSAPGLINSVRFWGMHINYITGQACSADQPHNFQITFIDSANGPAVQSYNVTVTGYPVPLFYGANYQMYMYDADLPSSCNLLSGRIRIVGNDNDGCVFHWATSPQGNNSVVLVNSGGTIELQRDMSLCLGRGCAAPDSVFINMFQVNFYPIHFRQVEQGYATLWHSTNIDAVFPATYTAVGGAYLPPGYYLIQHNSIDPQERYVVTNQCGPPPVSGTPQDESLFRRIE